ncbi:methionine adenosyltransferase [Streptomyces malaysiensis]|uniref:methionine adenosyltransferase n=1 Tax=Streptomyces malaysiensis TaxID=92644 RepID=UPI001C2E49AD|nr:methionine adenosyltransferase [Streptomyces samsunensis]
MTGTFVSIVSVPHGGGAAPAYELVERKGVGHPDTMCDAIAERASRYYAQYCVEHFGRVAHHWFDKVMLFGGEATIDFGEGELTKPYTVLYAGKGAYRYADQPIPLEDILFKAAADTLAEVTTGFDPERHLTVQCEVVDHQGSGRGHSRYRPQVIDDLIEIGDDNLVSNDCNLLHGYFPLSTLEAMVQDTEQLINGPTFKAAHPDTGWDVKVFGSRRADEYRLIVNMPFLAQHIDSMETYLRRKVECQQHVAEFLRQTFGLEPDLLFNPTDRNKRPYLTALGSVADTGDVGVVGRGNRLNGLITPMRSMSIEAPAGKNPLDHTGKLYGVLAHQLAREVSEAIALPVDTHIFTSKEARLDQPDEIVVEVHGELSDDQRSMADGIITKRLANMGDVTRELVFDGITMW